MWMMCPAQCCFCSNTGLRMLLKQITMCLSRKEWEACLHRHMIFRKHFQLNGVNVIMMRSFGAFILRLVHSDLLKT